MPTETLESTGLALITPVPNMALYQIADELRELQQELIIAYGDLAGIEVVCDPKNLAGMPDETREVALEELERVKASVEAISNQIAAYVTREVAKVDAYCAVKRQSDLTVEACKREETRVATIRRAHAKLIECLEGGAMTAMRLLEVKKLPGSIGGISRQANGGVPAVVIDTAQQDDIPDRFIRVTVEMPLDDYKRLESLGMLVRKGQEFNNTAIRKAIEGGELVPGAKLVRGEHVRW